MQAYPDYTFTFGYRSRTTAVDSLTLETYQPEGRGSVVVYRDSFLNTMQAYLAQSFEKALFSRAIPYQAELVKRQKADLTILQLTERSLGDYVVRAPQMAAPEVNLEGEARRISPERVSLAQEKTGNLLHFFGVIDESLLGETYRVYLMMGKPDQARAFEAFPIYEKELLGMAEGAAKGLDNGWSLYLPAELLEGETELGLCIESAGARYLAPLRGGEN